MRTPVFVPAAELDDIWPLVCDLAEAASKHDRRRWRPDDLVAALREGRAGLWLLTNDDDVPVGYLVTSVRAELHRRVLSLWTLGKRDRSIHFREWWDWVVAHAREMDCQVVQCVGRRAFQRIIPAMKPVAVVLECEV